MATAVKQNPQGEKKIVLTWEQLKQIAPNAPKNADVYVKYLNDTMEREQINTSVNRVAMFLSQAAHESMQFRRMVEVLKYRPERLMEVWPTRFISMAVARKYAGNERSLASFVYGNRYGNGDESTGDGYTYRGRGLFMLTFKDNYEAFGQYLKGAKTYFHADKADMVATPEYAVASAGWYWSTKGMNKYADKDDINGATKVLNGGLIGITERKLLYNKAKKILST